MNFQDALNAAFHDNDRITRTIWANRSIFVAVEETKLCIKGFNAENDDLYHPFIVSEQDFFADDWEVITDA